MRTVMTAVAAVLVFAGSMAWAEEQPTTPELAREVHALRQAVEALTRRVDELSERIEELQTLLGDTEEDDPGSDDAGFFDGFGDDFQRRGPDLKALRMIRLPQDPTKEQVRQYVRKILQASRGQNTSSSDDPQVHMLARVGPEHLDVLIDALGGRSSAEMYVVGAINRVAQDEHKAQVLEALPHTHGLVEVVLRQGWEEDARAILSEELRLQPEYLPTEWIEAVARLEDPETYDDLIEYFVHGFNRPWTYEAIRDLPGIELEEAVQRAWDETRLSPGGEAGFMIPIALEFGILDALEAAIEGLDGDEYWGREARRAVLRHTEARGSSEQIRQWFEENREKLVWDAEARKFRVKEAE